MAGAVEVTLRHGHLNLDYYHTSTPINVPTSVYNICSNYIHLRSAFRVFRKIYSQSFKLFLFLFGVRLLENKIFTIVPIYTHSCSLSMIFTLCIKIIFILSFNN